MLVLVVEANQGEIAVDSFLTYQKTALHLFVNSLIDELIIHSNLLKYLTH